MKNQPEFVRDNLRAAQTLLKTKTVRDLIFSRGTYQVEIQEKGKKRVFPFLQLKDDGEVTDSFCSCDAAEADGRCVHLAAAYLKIFNGLDEPLHVRFKKSLWNRLFQMASKRHGYAPECLTKEAEGYACYSKTRKRLFSIKAESASARKKLSVIVSERAVETEETSLKFSNWAVEEMASFREGKGSHALLYELSFWSDLAKWLMLSHEEGMDYSIAFEGQPVPNEITINFPQLNCWFYIAEANWPWLIPALPTVRSPLQAFDTQIDTIENIVYDPGARSLLIRHRGGMNIASPDANGVLLGEWSFVLGQGFYRCRDAPLFQKTVILPEEMAETLSAAARDLQRFLQVFPEPKKARYHLHFDPEGNFHIELYVFEEGDLRSESSACFIPWVYLDGKGFYFLEDWLFEGKEKVIPKAQMASFINHHRLWLHNFPAFQTHLGSLESHLTYRLSPEGKLSFEAELNFPEGYEEAHHFDEWLYVPGQGFYMKRENTGRLPIHPGLEILKESIPSFIASHTEELEQVQGFFCPDALIRKMGLVVALNGDGLISITPEREFAPGIDPKKMQFFENYLYMEGFGFWQIPSSLQLPERYREPTVIAPLQEASFLAYEIDPLKPYILQIDPRLQSPAQFRLKIRRIARDKKKRAREWLVDLVYTSEIGQIDPFTIWDGLQAKQKHLFSPAGLIMLKEPRFNWIRQLHKKRLDRKKGMVRLSTLEWIRLTIFEDLQVPAGESPEAIETRNLLEELNRLETERLLDLSLLKATLRPYQEQGVHWLWFLYCHGLSGLLCDDMGLGKTHQTMALLSAVSHEDAAKQNKYLVVCPTSVIYHWQELLRRFLPHLRVCTYYGVARSLQDFDGQYDLLLTSYGILRTGKEDIRSLAFEVAVFDEIQIAKNHASQTHKALSEIQSKMRVGLTGTPIENRLRELKSLIDIAIPSYLPADAVFRDVFINPIEKHNDEEKKALLGRLVKPFILRRKKSEVLTDLPEKIEEIAYCDLSEEQKQLYNQVAFKMKDTIYRDLQDASKQVSYVHVFTALMHLKQICDHPALFLGDVKNFREHHSGKWDLFIELLEEARASSQKIVVFSQYLDMLAMVESYLKRKGIGFASIKGSTRDRGEQLRKFREEPQCEVFVASLLAAGVGIDLTVASIVIHYDRWWNPAKENQATDRVHRIGQNRGVQVFKLVTKHTIEEHIHDLIERKKGLLEEIIGAEDQINYLSRDELVEVFEKMLGNGVYRT